MNNSIDIDKTLRSADMIVAGYAFSKMDDGNVRIVNIHPPHHAAVIRANGEMLETNMDNIEFSIVMDYWHRNKKLMEEQYAEVL